MRLVVVAVLAAWVVFFGLAPLHGLFWLHPGDFGMTTDSNMTVLDVDRGGGADRAGIQVGDRFAGATSFENRLYFQNVHNPFPGQSVLAYVADKGGSLRAVNIVAKSQEIDAAQIAAYFSNAIVALVFVLVSSIVVLLRPSKMTWAFFLYCVATGPSLVLGHYWLPPRLVFGVGVFADIFRSFGFGAFLIFCARAPNDRVFGLSRYVEWIAAPLVVISLLLCNAVIDLSIIGVMHSETLAGRIQTSVLDATYLIGILALITTCSRERGVERSRVAWIIAGFAIGLGARIAANLTDPGANIYTGDALSDEAPRWLVFIPTLEVAIPLAVAYAVVRHRALNVGFIANRTLVYGLFLCAGFAAFALLDFLVTKRFANDQFEVGLDMAVALVVGLSFQIFHPRAIRTIDRVFLPERYQAAVALDKLRTTLGRVGSDDDGPNRAVEAVAGELKLSSLAVFKRLPDGGFVRYAACGWPKGSAWHILAGDPLVRVVRLAHASQIGRRNGLGTTEGS